jgi:hypothetical protein
MPNSIEKINSSMTLPTAQAEDSKVLVLYTGVSAILAIR